MGKVIKDTIHANGIDIGIYTEDFENEFILLTDIARYKSDDPTAVIQNWMRNRDIAMLNQLLVLANQESYNAILINQNKNQKERMKLLRQLTVQQLNTLEAASMNNLIKIGNGDR